MIHHALLLIAAAAPYVLAFALYGFFALCAVAPLFFDFDDRAH